MEPSCSRFTPPEGGARLANTTREKNLIVTDHTTFIALRLLHEEGYSIRGSLRDGKKRSVYITRGSRVKCTAYDVNLLTDLSVVSAINYHDVTDWLTELDKKEVVVCTSAVIRRILEEGLLSMVSINVIIIDSCHLICKDEHLRYIMHLYKKTSETNRPRILALTYPFLGEKPIEPPNDTDTETCKGENENDDIRNQNDNSRNDNDNSRNLNDNSSNEISDSKNDNDISKCNDTKKNINDKIDISIDLSDNGRTSKDPEIVNDIDKKININISLIDSKIEIENVFNVSASDNCTPKGKNDTDETKCCIDTNDIDKVKNDIDNFGNENDTIKKPVPIGAYENLDDFDMYEKLEWKIDVLENELCCEADLAEDIDGVKRLQPAVKKPRELLVEFSSQKHPSLLPKDYEDLETYMRTSVNDVMCFLEDHRYDPMEIYGDDLYDELIKIPDPTIDPKLVLHQFLYVLDQLGPYAADKAAFALLAKLEKLRIKVPYERHFLLLCICTSVFVKIRCYADLVFSEFESDWEKIQRFSTPKLIRFVEILEKFKPPDLNSKNDNDNTDRNESDTFLGSSEMIQTIDSCDFVSLGNVIEDKINEYEANFKEIGDANIIESNKNQFDTELNKCQLNSSNILRNKTENEADKCKNNTTKNENNMKINANSTIKHEITTINENDTTNKNDITKSDNDTTNENDITKSDNDTTNENDITKNQKYNAKQLDASTKVDSNSLKNNTLGFPRRHGQRLKGRGRTLRPNPMKSQQNQHPDALCGIVFMKEPFMAKILFSLIVDLSRSHPALKFLSAQYSAIESVADPVKEPRDFENQRKKQEDVLKKFRMHDCNLLLATALLEQGIDLPRCNLVVRWDLPNCYRSHDLCKAHARAARASCLVMVHAHAHAHSHAHSHSHAHADNTGALVNYLATYTQIDQIISEKCGCGIEDEPDQSEEEFADQFTLFVQPYTTQTHTKPYNTDYMKECEKSDKERENNDKDCESYINEIDNIILESEINVNESEININESEININESEININESEININVSEININESEINIKNSSYINQEPFIKLNNKTDTSKINKVLNKEEIVQNDIENSESEAIIDNISNNSDNKLSNSRNDMILSENDKGLNDIENVGASVDLGSAIALINRYCGKLPSDTFTRLAPQWWLEEVHLPLRGLTGQLKKAYICTLRLPLNCPVKFNIVGHPMPTRVLAKRMVALQAVRILHKSGELDNNLMPISKENFQSVELDIGVPHSQSKDNLDPNDIARPGTTKRRQYYYKKTARAFTNCEPHINATDEEILKPHNPTLLTDTTSGCTNTLYAVVCVLQCALPERYNTRGRALHAPQHAAAGLALLLYTTHRMNIPQFPVYTRSGEVRVSLKQVPDADTRLSPHRRTRILRFMRFVFSEVLRVRRKGMRLDPKGCTHNNYYIVPTIKSPREDGSTKVDIDWDFLEVIYKYTEDRHFNNLAKNTPWQNNKSYDDDSDDDYNGNENENYQNDIPSQNENNSYEMKSQNDTDSQNDKCQAGTYNKSFNDNNRNENEYQYGIPSQNEKKSQNDTDSQNKMSQSGIYSFNDNNRNETKLLSDIHNQNDNVNHWKENEIDESTQSSENDIKTLKKQNEPTSVQNRYSKTKKLEFDNSTGRKNLESYKCNEESNIKNESFESNQNENVNKQNEKEKSQNDDEKSQNDNKKSQNDNEKSQNDNEKSQNDKINCQSQNDNFDSSNSKKIVKLMENPFLKPGEIFVFNAANYKEAVVTPWYRNQDQPQFFLVAEICWGLSPDSAFPSASHESFRSYYLQKYGVELTQPNQPLLDVDHTSARLNLLTPRYVNRKGVALPVSSERTRRAKRDRLDQKQILLPELCHTHPFPAPLWFATVALPAILYRVNALLIADEIRETVAREASLGVPKVTDPDFEWPPLHFGWSLEEVLNADTEKYETRTEQNKNDEMLCKEESEAMEKEIDIQREAKQQESVTETAISEISKENEVEDAASGFEIGTWSNAMASSITEVKECDEFMEPLPSDFTYCTSASGGTNWCNTAVKKKSDFTSGKTFSMADSDCSYMSSDFDTDDTDLNSGPSDDEESSGFGSARYTNAMGVRIEYKTAHEAEAVDLENKKQVNMGPKPSLWDDYVDRCEQDAYMHEGSVPEEYKGKFYASVEKHKIEIEKYCIVTQDEAIVDILPPSPTHIRSKQTKHNDENKTLLDHLFPYGTTEPEELFNTNEITLDNLEKNKKILMAELKRTLPEDEIKKMNCFSMIDITDAAVKQSAEDSLRKVSKEKQSNRDDFSLNANDSFNNEGLGKKVLGSEEFKPYYQDDCGLNGKTFDFDYQPDLEGHPGPSPSLILQALTMSNANDGINLERLETIGDSFLKLAITARLYCAHPTVHEGKLSHMRSKQVSNLNLYRLGRNKKLGNLMIASKFEPHDNWLPPCHKAPKAADFTSQVESQEHMTGSGAAVSHEGCFIPYNLITQHSIPDKSIADCVEALIGAYLVASGARGALLFMCWLGLTVLPTLEQEKSPGKVSQGKGSRVSISGSDYGSDYTDSERRDDTDLNETKTNATKRVYGELQPPPSPLLRYITDPEGELEKMLSGYEVLEETLQYRFRDRSLLLQAMTHASHHTNRLTDCYQRLEFLGDAILDYLITRHLFMDARRHSPGALTDLRSALVNNTIFATLAVRHHFHKFFRHMSPGLNEVLTKYVKIQEENGHSISEEHYLIQEDEMEQAEDVEVPKALGDLFESVAGAIFLDSGMSLSAVWRSYERLMRRELDAFSAAAPKSPVRELLEQQPDTAKFGKPERLADGRRVRVKVEVFGRGTFKGIGRNYRIAKGTAARCALRHLKTYNK